MNYLPTLLAATALLAARQVDATTLTFEDQAVGTILSNQYAALGVTFSPNAFTGLGSSSSGQDWATNTDMTIVSSAGDVGDLRSPSLVSGNVLRSLSGWQAENGDPSFRATFTGGASFFSATFAGVSIPADVRLFAYDGNTLLGTVAGGAPNTGQFTLSFSSALITSVVVAPGSYLDWVAVDDVTFTPVTAPPIPEPESYALLFAGLGVLGVVSRRLKR